MFKYSNVQVKDKGRNWGFDSPRCTVRLEKTDSSLFSSTKKGDFVKTKLWKPEFVLFLHVYLCMPAVGQFKCTMKTNWNRIGSTGAMLKRAVHVLLYFLVKKCH